MPDPTLPVVPVEDRAAVDDSSWDGGAAMSAAANSSDPAAEFAAICAGRRDGPPDQEGSWALPHHKSKGADPNAAGVRNALSRLPQTKGLNNSAAAKAHLDAHMSAIDGAEKKSADHDHDEDERALGVSGSADDAVPTGPIAKDKKGTITNLNSGSGDAGSLGTCADCSHMASCDCTTCECASSDHTAYPVPQVGMGRSRADRPPRDSLVRAMSRGPEIIRDATLNPNGMPTMRGHFAVFNQWTEIDSMWEGTFLERIAPGAFKKTISESRDQMRVLFNHGMDFHIGDKVLGAISTLREDPQGAYYEVPLFDTSYNRDLVPGLDANQYGASFRFRVMKEEFDENPGQSKYNPRGLPERTIREAQVMEFGPVTFPAYPGASAGTRSDSLRSLTDAYVFGKMDPDKLRAGMLEMAATMRNADPPATTPEAEPDALPESGAEDDPHSDDEGSRGQQPEDSAAATAVADSPPPADNPPPAPDPIKDPAEDLSKGNRQMPEVTTIEERRTRADAIATRFQEIHSEYGASALPEDVRKEWDQLISERNENNAAISDYERRSKELEIMAGDAGPGASRLEPGESQWSGRQVRKIRGVPDNVHAIDEYRTLARSYDDLKVAYRDGAMSIVERATFVHPEARKDQTIAFVQRMLEQKDVEGQFAQRVINTSSPVYARAFGKTLKGSPLDSGEQRALALGSDPDGGFAVPFQLDPTVILTSNGTVNPLRRISRVETIVGKEWQGVTSEGVTVTRTTEADEATDDSPTLDQPVVKANRVQGFIPFSVEIGQDWGSLQSEMAVLLADAKDIEEATSFTLGNGSDPNAGGIVGSLDNASLVLTITNDTFAVDDIYKLEDAVPVRFRSRSQFVANRAIYNKVRGFGTAGQPYGTLFDPTVRTLIGYPSNEASDMASSVVDAAKILLLGDFSKFLIVDRLGMSIELIPHLFGVSGRPTGQRGIYAIWRNNSVILTSNAFRLLKVQ